MAVTFGLALHGGVDLTSLAQSVIGTAVFPGLELHNWPASSVLPDPLGERHADQRGAGHHDHPVCPGAHGADHRRDRRAHSPRSFCRRHPRRLIADSHPPHRRAAARADHRAFHAGLFWRGGAERRPPGAGKPFVADPCDRVHRDCQHRQIQRSLYRRRLERSDMAGIAGPWLGYERSRLDRSHRRISGPFDGCAQPGPFHDYRDDGGGHDDVDAADAALGAGPAAAPARRKRANRTRRIRSTRLRQQHRASARRCRSKRCGRLASRLAGRLSGSRQIPSTVLQIGSGD
jgi:hypothetical protein